MSAKRTPGAGKGPTAAQLREEIDRGATGDKVDFPDPAASPLGTDAEAGGAPPTSAEVATALQQEVAARSGPRPQARTIVAVGGFLALIAAAAAVSLLVMAG